MITSMNSYGYAPYDYLNKQEDYTDYSWMNIPAEKKPFPCVYIEERNIIAQQQVNSENCRINNVLRSCDDSSQRAGCFGKSISWVIIGLAIGWFLSDSILGFAYALFSALYLNSPNNSKNAFLRNWASGKY